MYIIIRVDPRSDMNRRPKLNPDLITRPIFRRLKKEELNRQESGKLQYTPQMKKKSQNQRNSEERV